MNLLSLIHSLRSRSNLWFSLQIYNLHRLILASMVMLANKFNVAPEFLSANHPNLFIVSAYSYFIFAVFAFYFTWQHNPFRKTFSYLGPILDLLFVSAFMEASGGITHGMGVLLIIIVIAQALLNPGYWAIATPFLGCILLISIQLYDWVLYPVSRTSLFPTLILGLTCIGSALITSMLVKRLVNQSLALSTAEQLNSLIVSLMQQGVIIIDQQDNIKLINHKAKQLLNLKMSPKTLSLKRLQDLLPQKNYRLEIKPWGECRQTASIIFLYDLTEERKRAQILKLASLGQLAANIAHEIRNPLFAVNQSAELLKESNNHPKNERLFQLLLDNSNRIDTVIKNVSSLSTKMLPHPEELALIPWLDNFTKDLYFTYSDKLDIKKKYTVEALQIHFDASQLRQILLNICENGIRHSLQKHRIATLKIEVSVSKNLEKNLIHIDIIDNGPGLSEETAKHLFEPFYTTEKNGSGLGLFISKELLEMNGCYLSFSNHHPTGCQFRVTLDEN